MKIDFPLEEAIKKRYSVRNYDSREIEPEKMTAIRSFIAALDNPFGIKVNFHFLDFADVKNKEKLGTYGIIKGAGQYIGTTVAPCPLALEALGYELEAVILYLTHLVLGTCWLGGTFGRKEFAGAMQIPQDALFPAVTPFGYPAAKKHIKEKMMRKIIGADNRREWDKLFFNNEFAMPLAKEEAGGLGFALEMIRLGPSASNKQPWRLVLKEDCCHFYEYKEPGYSAVFPYDIQRIDMGIAAAHFDFATKEKGIPGSFLASGKPDLQPPAHTNYVFSWFRK